MPELNKDKIFNGSSKKVLIREYENLKKDFSKLGAFKYYALYENESLSFILENSRYIFTEPIKGYEFYKNIIESVTIPFDKMEDELYKVESYLDENKDKMSDDQKQMYTTLLESVSSMVNNNRHSIDLYNGSVEFKESAIPCYDALYEYKKTNSEEALSVIEEMMNNDVLDIMNVVHIVSKVPELSSNLYNYMESAYVENPTSVDNFKLNAYTYNTLARMMMDKDIYESVNDIRNVNARHLIVGLSGVNGNDMIDDILIEKVVNYNPQYINAMESVNRIFEDDMYSEAMAEENDFEKMNRLLCEKTVINADISYLILDSLYSESTFRNPIVEKICIESSTMDHIPTDVNEQIKLLQERSEELDSEISLLEEKYFSSNGGPGKIVAQSIGNKSTDENFNKADSSEYTPHKKMTDDDSDKDDSDKEDSDEDDEDETKDTSDEDDEDDDTEAVQEEVGGAGKIYTDIEYYKGILEDRKQKLAEKEHKYNNMPESDAKKAIKDQIDDLKDKIEIYQNKYEDAVRHDAARRRTRNENNNKGSFHSSKFVTASAHDDTKIADNEIEVTESIFNKEKYPEVEKPEKKNVFQRIQNKALDTDVQFKKKVAEAKRTSVDARNAGKAVAKIPTNVGTAVKKQVDEWDELDDDRRKEYIIKPGFRKKYFKALKLCILHYGAFAINPVLNIVLAICHKFSNIKDIRIRNELIRELKAEIKVTEEKIEDARAAGDNKQKYELIRIKEKLDAEVNRVGANSKFL